MSQLVLQPKLLEPQRGVFGHYQPGERFSYKSTDPALLGIVLRRATGVPYAKWLQQAVFDPMGADLGGLVEHDREGYGLTSAGVRLSLANWERFALWVRRVSLEPGCLGDHVRSAMAPQINNPGPPGQRRFGTLFDSYGFFFWTGNRIAPSTTFASGYGGQRISWHHDSNRMAVFFSTEESWMPALYGVVRDWNSNE